MDNKALSMISDKISKQFGGDDGAIGDRIINIIKSIYQK